MKAELISIGDELLIGQVLNTNSAWIAQQLNMAGVAVGYMTTVADGREEILDALKTAGQRAELVIITGGLGPTKDDITKATVCEFLQVGLEEDPITLADVSSYFEQRGRKLNDVNRAQALIPKGSKAIRNAQGTAPGIWFDKDKTHYFCLPGVPYEMKPMVSGYIIPELKKLHNLPYIHHCTILTQGIGESDIAAIVETWEDALAAKQLKLAYLPKPGQVRLRISGSSYDKEALESLIQKEAKTLQSLIGRYIYGFEAYGEETEGLAQVVSVILKKQRKTLSVAESCTGGYLSSKITALAGASEIFKGSIVPYTNQAKHELLNVDSDIFEKYGAVSEECVLSLAKHVRERFHSDFSIAISGVAGPTGGSPEKPVGTVWIAVASQEETWAKKFRFGTDRQRNITMSTEAALDLLRVRCLEPSGEMSPGKL